MFHNFTKKCKLVDKTQRVWDQKLTKAKFEKSIICIFKFLRFKTKTKNLSIGHLTHSKANYVKISRPTPLIFRRFGGYTRYLRWLNREFQMYFISEKTFLPSFNLYLSLTGIFKSIVVTWWRNLSGNFQKKMCNPWSREGKCLHSTLSFITRYLPRLRSYISFSCFSSVNTWHRLIMHRYLRIKIIHSAALYWCFAPWFFFRKH